MNIKKISFMVFLGLCLMLIGAGAPKKASEKKRIMVVSSYHREYLWTQDTNKGFCAALLKLGYFDNQAQADEYTRSDYVETSKVIIQKAWMDAKRKNDKSQLEETASKLYRTIKDFKPDIIFLGDDEAGNYIGSKFLDTEVPIVFWGFNDNPVKYGLVDTADRPGHNVTGVYQSGYYEESLQLLKAIVPRIKTFAVLTDETPTGRAHYKAVEYLARKGRLPFTLVESVMTNDYELWKAKALELQAKVDAFYVAQFSGIKDKAGNPVSNSEVINWYLTNIKIPEASRGHFIKQGLLCAADDSGYKQAFEAVTIAHDILSKGKNPATYPSRTPLRGALMVNKQRAEMLGIKLTPEMGIEEYVKEATALKEAK